MQDKELQAWLNRFEDKFDRRLDKVEDDVKTVRIMTEKNAVILEEHQRRSLANEKRADLLEEQVELYKKDNEEKLSEATDAIELKQKELADSVELFTKLPGYIAKIAVWLAAVAAGGSALFAIFNFFLTHASK